MKRWKLIINNVVKFEVWFSDTKVFIQNSNSLYVSISVKNVRNRLKLFFIFFSSYFLLFYF